MLETFSKRTVELIDDALKKGKSDAERSGENLCVNTYYLLYALNAASDTICHFLLSELNITNELITSTYLNLENYEIKSINFTKEFEEVVTTASNIAQMFNSEYVYDEHLFYAALSINHNLLCDILVKLNVDIELLKDDILDIFSFNTEITFPKEKEEDLKCLINLTKKQKVHPYIGGKTYLNEISYILNKRQKNNPLLIGMAGVGKTSLVEGLTSKIKKTIYQLDLGLVIAGTKYRGEMEEKIIKAIEYVKLKKGILFIDEIHNIVGGGSNEGSLDIANLLKPYLSSNDLQVIAATTLDEYYKYFEHDQALNRRFQTIFIEEPSLDETINILRGIKPLYEKFYNHKISDKTIKYVVMMASNIPNRHFPDKAIDLLDEALSKKSFVNDNLNQIIKMISIQRGGIRKINNIDLTKLNYPILLPLYEKKKFFSPINNGIVKVNKDFDISTLISDLKKVYGFKEEMLLTIDLTDYQSSESISDLIGTSKGYIGFEQSGLLYNHFLKHPFSVVYLKNFYAAIPYIKSFFLNIFKKKLVFDNHSRQIYLTNVMFVVEDDNEQNSIGFISGSNNKRYYNYSIKSAQLNNALKNRLDKKGINIINLTDFSNSDQENIYIMGMKLAKGNYKVVEKDDNLTIIDDNLTMVSERYT